MRPVCQDVSSATVARLSASWTGSPTSSASLSAASAWRTPSTLPRPAAVIHASSRRTFARSRTSTPGSASARSKRSSTTRNPSVTQRTDASLLRAKARTGPGCASRIASSSSSEAFPASPANEQSSAAAMRRRMTSSTALAGVNATASSPSSAAAWAAPRTRAWIAAVSSAAAISSSGPVAAIARCRARSSESTSSAARRRWSRRLLCSGIAV